MKQVRITAAARDALERFNYASEGRGMIALQPQPDGSFMIDLEPETLEQLEQHRFPQDSISDVLIQLCNRGRNQ